MELYQNDLRDLLLHPSERHAAPKLVIRRDGKGVVYVEGVTVREAESREALSRILTSGLKHRSVAGTRMNSESSRSHLIFCILIETVNIRTQRTTLGKLTLVDLAGSERVSRSGVKGQGLKEATVSSSDVKIYALACKTKPNIHRPLIRASALWETSYPPSLRSKSTYLIATTN